MTHEDELLSYLDELIPETLGELALIELTRSMIAESLSRHSRETTECA